MVGMKAIRALGALWVVRSHQVEYLAPAFAGDVIQVQTWVVNFSRVRSLRRYRFLRVSDGKIIVRGETDWVYVSSETGKPVSIPEQVKTPFVLVDQA